MKITSLLQNSMEGFWNTMDLACSEKGAEVRGGGEVLDSHMLALMGHLHMSHSFLLEFELIRSPE